MTSTGRSFITYLDVVVKTPWMAWLCSFVHAIRNLRANRIGQTWSWWKEQASREQQISLFSLFPPLLWLSSSLSCLQVSHHPPVSALHATNEKENLELIWCHYPTPKFYGTWISANSLFIVLLFSFGGNLTTAFLNLELDNCLGYACFPMLCSGRFQSNLKRKVLKLWTSDLPYQFGKLFSCW